MSALAGSLGRATKSLKYFVDRNDAGLWGDEPEGKGGTPVLRSTDQTVDGHWSIVDPAVRLLSDAQAQATRLEVGDIVVTKSSGSSNHIGKSTLVNEEVAALGASFGNFMQRLRFRAEHDPRYFWYLLNHGLVRRQFDELSTTSTGLANLNGSIIGRVEIPEASPEEQRVIADYLDRETARIDTLIGEQQRLIEMLRERRDATWDADVDAARGAGVLLPVRRVIASIVDGPFGSSLTSAHYADEGARVIRLGNVGINEFKDHDFAFIPIEYAGELEAHAVVAGDVVVAGLGDDRMPLGRAAVVPDLGAAIVKADCYRVRPNDLVSPQYLAWVMSAPQTGSQIMLLARGATRARLNTKVVQQVEIPVPDRATQAEIVARSAAKIKKIEGLIVETERFIELSRERRAALITAAVTGQIDVREVA